MISFPDALALLISEARPAVVEGCRIENAAGRILRQRIIADRSLPPYDRVMMDGYALRWSDWQGGCRTFQVVDSAPAGKAARALPSREGSCIEVMTGAPCPAGADVIVPVEEVVLGAAGKEVTFREIADPQPRRFIHKQGSDIATGELLLEAGVLLGARELGVAASCGAGWLEVAKIPSIAVVATGDELVPVDETPAPHQIRQSNAHALAAALYRGGFPASRVWTCGDEAAVVQPELAEILMNHQWTVLTGAVSKGARDFVPQMLEELGFRRLFHGVSHRPGKPAGCWIGKEGRVAIALPGNPVSALVGLQVFVLPALAAAAGLAPAAVRRHALAEPLDGLPGFTWHLPVRLRDDGLAVAAPPGNSGDFIGLLKSDGFLTIPPLEERLTNTTFPFTPWL